MRARRLTLAGLLLLAFVCLLYSGERFFLWVIFLIAAVFILALLNIAYTLRYLVMRQTMSPAELTAGETGTLVVNVHNQGLFPLAHVDLWYDSFDTLVGAGPGGEGAAAEVAAHSFVSGVLPGGARNIRQEIFLPYRGSFEPGVIKARLSDVFGLLSCDLRQSAFARKQQVTVLPRTASPALDSWGENPFTGGLERGRDEQEPYSVAEIRQYRPGDPLKRVHWKLSARTGQLQVKEYDGTLSPRASVFLDLSPHGLRGEEAAAFEDCMCGNAAALCAAALGSFIPLRLAVCAEEAMALTGLSPQELIVFRRFLAGLTFDCPYDFRDVVRMEMDARPETGHILLVTAALTPALSDYLASLATQGRDVSLIIVSKEFSEASADAAQDEPLSAGEAPTGAQPTGTRPAGAQPTGAQPASMQPASMQPTGAQPAGAQPVAMWPGPASASGDLAPGLALGFSIVTDHPVLRRHPRPSAPGDGQGGAPGYPSAPYRGEEAAKLA